MGLRPAQRRHGPFQPALRFSHCFSEPLRKAACGQCLSVRIVRVLPVLVFKNFEVLLAAQFFSSACCDMENRKLPLFGEAWNRQASLVGLAAKGSHTLFADACRCCHFSGEQPGWRTPSSSLPRSRTKAAWGLGAKTYQARRGRCSQCFFLASL